jgi:amino acid adenylation domain-containing protein
VISIDELLTLLRQKEVRIWAEGDKLRYSARDGAFTPDVLEAISHHKDDLLEVIHRVDAFQPAEEPTIRRYPRSDFIPLSYAQQGMWFLHQLEGNHPAYSVLMAMRLRNRLDIEALEKSLAELVRRHESLRTCFPNVGGQPFQRILEPMPHPLRLRDLQDFEGPDQNEQIQKISLDFGTKPFDLENGPLFRNMLIRFSPEDHILLLSMHHIITDGWSLRILFAELNELYEAFSTCRPHQLKDLNVQYADFTLWQRKWLQADRLQPLVEFWRERLADTPEAIALNTDKPRPPVATFNGGEILFNIGPDLAGQLKELGERAGTTSFMTLLAAYAALLHRYSGMDDLVIGSPAANRTHTELEGIIGFFVNTLALRVNLQGDPTFMELLARVREMFLEAYAHQELPFEILVQSLEADRDLSRNPLFQVMFAFQSRPSVPTRIGHLDVEKMIFPLGISRFDINLMILGALEGFTCRWEYNSDLFHQDTAVQMSGHLLAILEAAVQEPGLHLSEIPLLSDNEREVLLDGWSTTCHGNEILGCTHKWVEDQVKRAPAEIAIEYKGTKISYLDLNRMANQLAHNLQKRGVGPDVLVGIYMQRSINAMLGVLGVLKAGGAYVPLDPTYPKERIAFMLSDSQVGVILTDESLGHKLPENLATVLSLGEDWQAFSQESTENPVSEVNDQNLAYVMYTSGSTGFPKGVAMPHRGLSNLINWQLRHSTVPKAKTLQFTTLSFDVSFQEIFATWCGGGTLVLISDEAVRDFQMVGKVMAEAHVERLFIPFAGLQHLADVLDDEAIDALHLKEVYTAGEQLRITPPIVRLFSRLNGCVLHNHYGPTETHVITAHRLRGKPQDWPTIPPIGRPIDNAQVFILDPHMEPVPIGVTGDLYAGGPGLARGYINRPDEDRERFIPHPFEDAPDERLYKTGDLARYLRNGDIEFLGRTDDQVKIRGFRVELGEIETVLGQLPEVQTCVVSMKGDRPGDQQLTAYIIPREGSSIDFGAIKRNLRRKLPEHMIPSSLVQIESLPMTPSGKVDRRGLPEPRSMRSEQVQDWVGPRDSLEHRIAAVWEQVLGIYPIGVHEDFFDLGGHSLMAVRLISGIAKTTGITLPIAAMFQASTIEDQAEVLRSKDWQEKDSSLVIIQTGGTKPPLFCIHYYGGNVLIYRDLARLLARERTVYGLQALGLEGKTRPHTRIEEMAAHYIEEIRSVQPVGPYHLAGASMGGNIAYEMARQLKSMGEEVGVVALFDTVGIPKNSRPMHDRVQIHLMQLGRRTFQDKIGYLLERSRFRITRFIYGSYLLTGLPLPRFLWDLEHTTLQAFINYRPGQFDGDVMLFRATHRAPGTTKSPYLGWDTIIGGKIKIVEVPGEHATILMEPGVRVVAKALIKSLQDVELGPEVSLA